MDFLSKEDVRQSDDIREELQPYLLSQYSASQTIAKLLSDFRENIKPDADIALFRKNIMDIDTAVGYGLDVWGNILGIKRSILGMDNETVYVLGDNDYRKLLMYKALANILDSTMASLNKMLSILLEGVDIIAVNRMVEGTLISGEKYNMMPMHVRFTINGAMTDVEKALFVRGGLLCLATGVGWSVMFSRDDVFGFRGSELAPFNQGVFINSDDVIDDGESGDMPINYSVIITQTANQTITVIATRGGVSHTYTESFAIDESGYDLQIFSNPDVGYLAGNLIINETEYAVGQVSMKLRDNLTITATEAEVGREIYANGTIGWYSFGWDPSHWIFYTNEECTSSIGKDQLRGKLILHDVSNASAAGRVRGQCLFGSTNKLVTPRCEYVTEITQNVHTGDMTILNQAFASCYTLRKINNLSGWDVKNVTDMSSMFAYCDALVETGDISHWNTTSLQTASGMFQDCDAIKSIDLSGWNTPLLRNVNSMFFRCYALQIIDISGWDTSNINDVGNMVASTNLKYVIMDSQDIKFSGGVSMPNANNSVKYLVPENMVDAYKAHANWSSRASRIDSINNYSISRSNGQITVTPIGG